MKTQEQINIEKATGFVLCEFKGDSETECNGCEKIISEGSDVYYHRTNYECDEGEYYCASCSLAMPEYWKKDCENLLKLYEDTKGGAE